MTTARDFLARMKALPIEHEGDPEYEHINKDKLICEALLFFAQGRDDEDVARMIVQQYTDMGGWYA